MGKIKELFASSEARHTAPAKFISSPYDHAQPLDIVVKGVRQNSQVPVRLSSQKVEGQRIKAWELRALAGDILGGRYRYCGCRLVSDTHAASVRSSKQGLHVAGLQSCGSVWACPRCAHKITSGRKKEVAGMLHWTLKQGMASMMVTLTIRHKRNDSLNSLLNLLKETKRRVTRHRAIVEGKTKCGFFGEITATELTHSYRNGWHPHFHLLITAKGSIEELQAYCDTLVKVWVKALGNSAEISAQDIQPVLDSPGIAKYLTKWGAAEEITCGLDKKGKGGNTPFQILEHAKTDRKYRGLYYEYFKATKGRMQLTFSRGYKSKITDEQILKEEPSESVTIVNMSKDVFKNVTYKHGMPYLLNFIGRTKDSPEFIPLLIDYFKRSGYDVWHEERSNTLFPSVRINEHVTELNTNFLLN